MNTLPNGWVPTTVRDLAGTSGLFVDGDWVESKDQDPNGDIRLLQLADIGDGVFLDKSDRWINEEAFTRLRCTELEAGDVLIARMPDPLGRACLMPPLDQRCVTVVDVAALRVDPQVADNRWVMHTVNAPQLRAEINAQASGTTRKRISRGNLGGLPIPLPPESEQRRIADKLDTVLTRVGVASARLARVAPILKRFRQSVLESMTRGNAPEQELRFLLQAVRTGPFGSALHKSDYVQDGIPVVNPMHIVDGEIHPSSHMTVTTETAERLSEFRLMAGDVVIGRRGEMGRCAVVSDAQAGWLCGTGSMILRPKKDVKPHFLRLVLSRPSSVRALEGDSVGSTMINLNQGILLSLQVSRPSTERQAEIVHRVEALFAFADRLEARLQTAQSATERLTPALLAKAFRGDLVPQDPNDEPASELLRRLQQEAPSTSTRRGRKSAT